MGPLRNFMKTVMTTDKNSKKKGKKLIRLTDKNINKLQNYYDIAIRSSTGDTIWCFKKVSQQHFIIAVMPEQRHQFCPKNESSWC